MERLIHSEDFRIFSGVPGLLQFHGLVKQEVLITVVITMLLMHLCSVSGNYKILHLSGLCSLDFLRLDR